MNGEKEQGAEVVVDGVAYATSNGEVTVKDLTKGNHSFDYNDPDVWGQWLIVRNDLNGSNIQQKDIVDTDSSISVNADTTVYLLKIPKSWDMPGIGNAIDYYGVGLRKFKKNLIPMVVNNLYSGDASKTKNYINQSSSEFNKSQIRGEFTSERQKTEVSDFNASNPVADPKAEITIKNIGPFDASHAEYFTGYEITKTMLELAGNPSYVDFDMIVHEHIQGFTHLENDTIMRSLHDGQSYTKLGKDSVMTYVQFDPATRFKSSNASPSQSAKQTNMQKSSNMKDEQTPSLDLNTNIGEDANVSLSMSGRGADKRIGIGGRFNIEFKDPLYPRSYNICQDRL